MGDVFDWHRANRGVTATLPGPRGPFRESGERAFGKQRAQTTPGRRRRQGVRPERVQRSARAEHPTPGPQGTREPYPVSR